MPLLTLNNQLRYLSLDTALVPYSALVGHPVKLSCPLLLVALCLKPLTAVERGMTCRLRSKSICDIYARLRFNRMDTTSENETIFHFEARWWWYRSSQENRFHYAQEVLLRHLGLPRLSEPVHLASSRSPTLNYLQYCHSDLLQSKTLRYYAAIEMRL